MALVCFLSSLHAAPKGYIFGGPKHKVALKVAEKARAEKGIFVIPEGQLVDPQHYYPYLAANSAESLPARSRSYYTTELFTSVIIIALLPILCLYIMPNTYVRFRFDIESLLAKGIISIG